MRGWRSLLEQLCQHDSVLCWVRVLTVCLSFIVNISFVIILLMSICISSLLVWISIKHVYTMSACREGTGTAICPSETESFWYLCLVFVLCTFDLHFTDILNAWMNCTWPNIFNVIISEEGVEIITRTPVHAMREAQVTGTAMYPSQFLTAIVIKKSLPDIFHG